MIFRGLKIIFPVVVMIKYLSVCVESLMTASQKKHKFYLSIGLAEILIVILLKTRCNSHLEQMLPVQLGLELQAQST